jgi:hypothetical protein
VVCGGARHTVRWRKGRVVLEDHDVAAERALVALGGEPCICLELLAAWRQGVALPGTLRWLRAPAVPPSSEGLTFLAQLHGAAAGPVSAVSTRSGGWFGVPTVSSWQITVGSGAPSPAQLRQMTAFIQQRERQRHLWQLLASSRPDWLLRAATAAAVHMLRHPNGFEPGEVPEEDVDLGDLVRACAVPAVEENMRRWRGPRSARQWLSVECHPFEGAGPPSVEGSIDDHGGQAIVRLPLRWLVDVWARNATFVDDCFVLAARRIDGATLSVVLLRWDRDLSTRSFPVIAEGTAKRVGDHWRLL